MEELKALLKDEKKLITVLEDHLKKVEGQLNNISGMREDFQELFGIFKVFIGKQEAFMDVFMSKIEEK